MQGRGSCLHVHRSNHPDLFSKFLKVKTLHNYALRIYNRLTLGQYWLSGEEFKRQSLFVLINISRLSLSFYYKHSVRIEKSAFNKNPFKCQCFYAQKTYNSNGTMCKKTKKKTKHTHKKDNMKEALTNL